MLYFISNIFGGYMDTNQDARLDTNSLKLHRVAAKLLDEIKDKAFKYIFETVAKKGSISEYEVQQFILDQYKQNNLVTDNDPPIVANGLNATNPHHTPTANNTGLIKKNDMVLIDIWAKVNDPAAVWADITWMGYVGDKVPKDSQKIYDIVHDAAQKAMDFVNETLPKRAVQGKEIDKASREYIEKYGYGEYFTHNTGHSLSVGEDPHGFGPNAKKTSEEQIVDRCMFTIEPGIYLPNKLGVRVENDIYIENKKAILTTRMEKDIVTPKDL
jgi:Xaa-Pro aminopeptidase